MQIFNIQVNGADAVWVCSLPREQKIEWIKNNTNCQSDVLIEEFLNSPIKENCGCGCGGNKQNTDGNISKAVQSEVEAIDVASTSGDSERTVSKRRRNPKNS